MRNVLSEIVRSEQVKSGSSLGVRVSDGWEKREFEDGGEMALRGEGLGYG